MGINNNANEETQMVQLKKASNPIFHGNGLGTTTAGWTVKGSEHIAVRQLGTTWVAVDALKDGVKVATAFDRKSLIEKLSAIISS
jgi:predicted permease